MANKNQGLTLSRNEWTAVGAVGAAGMVVGGPLGAAGAVAGVVGGTYVAKKLGWVSDDDDDNGNGSNESRTQGA